MMATAAPLKVLVVDDEPAIRRFLRTSLTAQGYHVTEAENGAVALEKLRRGTTDILVLDLGLPDINGFDIIEIRESRASDPARRMTEESIAIANVIPEDGAMVILDERGESMSSPSIAGRLQGWRAQNKATVAFIVGGHDGLAPSLREKAELAIAFGAATWPHRLARIMLLEQIYRAITLLAGHPYHRG